MVVGAKEVGCTLCVFRVGLPHLLNDVGFSYYTCISLAQLTRRECNFTRRDVSLVYVMQADTDLQCKVFADREL